MVKCVGVIPYIHQPYFDACIGTLKLPSEDIVAIDNTKRNLGVAESWNRGIDYVSRIGADWLIIISAAMRFGEPGGLDMIEQLEKHPEANIVRFAEKHIPEQQFDRGNNPSWNDGVFYWHCTAISKKLIDEVGYFDPNFYPIYFEDTDYDLRIAKAGFKESDIIVPIDAKSVSVGHASKLAGVDSPSAPLVAYFATKWGRHPGAPQLGSYDTPFNALANSLKFFPPAHGRKWDE